ncbi:MAG: carboxyl transferase domain-containing protein, partial [Christensenellaceae bacterium]
MVTGFCTVDGRRVYVYAQDFTVMGGALGRMHARRSGVYDAAIKTGVPVLAIMDRPARIRGAALDGYAQIYKRSVDASGLIPQIALVCGPCPGAAAFAAALCDFTIVVDKNGAVFGRGPQVISAAEGKQVSAQELGGAMVASEKSALAQIFAVNEDDGIAKARMLLKLLPSNNLEDAPADLCEDDLNRECPALNGYVAGESDMHLAVEAIADAGSVLEVMPYYALNMV